MSSTAGSRPQLVLLRDRIRQLEAPARHGVLPFGVAAIDAALPDGGLALGAVHEIIGAGGDEEDAAAAAGFAAGLLARLGASEALAYTPRHSGAPRSGEPGTQAHRPLEYGFRVRSGGPPRNDSNGGVSGAGSVLWCLKQPDLYGPGLAAHGLDPARLVLATARRDDELLWAVEEGLRTPGLGAVVGEVGRLPLIAGRRLQLAAERSGVTLLLVRRWRGADEAAAERVRPSAAVTRWRIAALPSATPSLILPREPGREHKITLPRERGREGWGLAAGSARWVGKPRWRVELVRCRGGQAPAQWDVEVADATGHVSLSAELADRPAAPQRRRREPRRRLAG